MTPTTYPNIHAAGRPKVGDRIPAPPPASPTSARPRSRSRRPRHLIEVRGAGGVVWRTGPNNQIEVLLIHRPRLSARCGPEWSLPKGRAEAGESARMTAVREVHEEAGVRARIDVELASSAFRSLSGRPKVIRYFAMRTDDEPAPNGTETDAVAWLPLDEAYRRVTHDRDRAVLDSFVELAPLLTR